MNGDGFMATYVDVLSEMVKKYGIRKVIAASMHLAKIFDDKTVGQFKIHVNNGGVTKITIVPKEIEISG